MLRFTLAVVCSLLPLGAAEISGFWTGSFNTGGRERPLAFEFRQTGDVISGAFGVRGDFMWPLEDVRLSGSALAFRMNSPMGGPAAGFQGSLEEGFISGQLTSDVAALAGKVELRRAGPPLRLPASIAKPSPGGDLASLSDEFDSPASFKTWKNLADTERLPNRVEKIDIGTTAPGQLTIVPRSGAWWAGYHGIFLFKEVTGDFIVTTRLKVTGKTGGEPSVIWTISGLLLRAPVGLTVPLEQRKENWIYLMTGRGPGADRVVDSKSTLASENSWDITPAQPGWYELRIARLGPLFVSMCRQDGGDWVLRKRIFRADLPETLQAGINVTSDYRTSATMPAAKYNAELFPDQSKPDALTAFDYVRFSRVPAAPALRARLAGADVLGISDADLLALFR